MATKTDVVIVAVVKGWILYRQQFTLLHGLRHLLLTLGAIKCTVTLTLETKFGEQTFCVPDQVLGTEQGITQIDNLLLQQHSSLIPF